MDVLQMMEMLFCMVHVLSTAIFLQTARYEKVYCALESARFIQTLMRKSQCWILKSWFLRSWKVMEF